MVGLNNTAATYALRIEDSITQGVFLQETKNRFRCIVLVEGIEIPCYVPSSCRLEPLISLVGKNVLLIPTRSKSSKVRFSLLAVEYRHSYILLNSNMANTIIGSNLEKRRFSFLGSRKVIFREHMVDGYKCDYYIKDTDTMIEIKSVITPASVAEFPSVFSQRALLQFERLRQHLLKGSPVCYMIVSLNPNTKSIRLCEASAQYKPFIECIKLGMMVIGISCGMIKGRPNISKSIPIVDPNGNALK